MALTETFGTAPTDLPGTATQVNFRPKVADDWSSLRQLDNELQIVITATEDISFEGGEHGRLTYRALGTPSGFKIDPSRESFGRIDRHISFPCDQLVDFRVLSFCP